MLRALPLLVIFLLACANERIVEVPVVVEKEVVKVVEVPIVVTETIVKEVPVEVIVEKLVEVEVPIVVTETIVKEVPVEVIVEKLVEVEVTPTPTPALHSTPIVADAIVTKLKEHITAGLIGEPEILVCDTQLPESACIGIEVGGLIFSGMNRETGRAFAIAIEYHDLLANVQTCQFEWLTPAATMLCDTDILDKEEAKLSLAYAVMTKWPELADKLTSVVE